MFRHDDSKELKQLRYHWQLAIGDRVAFWNKGVRYVGTIDIDLGDQTCVVLCDGVLAPQMQIFNPSKPIVAEVAWLERVKRSEEPW